MEKCQLNKNEHMQSHNYLFVHIPKTGGRSVLSVMDIKFHCEHKSIEEYIKDLGEEEVRKRFKFTIIRNPWDRAVSWYRFFYKPMPNMVPLTFDQWIRKNQNGRIFNRPDNPSFNRAKIPLDVLSYCRNSSGEILMDKFLRFEHLEEDFKEIADRFKITKPLPHIGKEDKKQSIHSTKHLLSINKTGIVIAEQNSLNYRDLYTCKESIDIIADMNRELIEKFGYIF